MSVPERMWKVELPDLADEPAFIEVWVETEHKEALTELLKGVYGDDFRLQEFHDLAAILEELDDA